MTASGPVQETTAWSLTRSFHGHILVRTSSLEADLTLGGWDVYVMRDERDDEEGALQREVREASLMRRAPSMVLMQRFHPTPMSASLLSYPIHLINLLVPGHRLHLQRHAWIYLICLIN